MSGTLDDRDLAILELEARLGDRPAEKAAEIRMSLGLSPARYYQLLFALADNPAALEHDPLLIRRIQRVRDSRLRARRTRSLGTAAHSPSEDH